MPRQAGPSRFFFIPLSTRSPLARGTSRKRPVALLGLTSVRRGTSRTLHRPYSFRRRVRRSPTSAALERTEGARDAKGPDGPADLDASRHRGLSKSDSAASPPNPRRPAHGVFRFAPRNPRWADIVTHRLRASSAPERLTPLLGGVAPCGRHIAQVATCRVAGLRAAWTAGGLMVPHLRHPAPATAPRPASGDADQTPLGHGAG